MKQIVLITADLQECFFANCTRCSALYFSDLIYILKSLYLFCLLMSTQSGPSWMLCMPDKEVEISRYFSESVNICLAPEGEDACGEQWDWA